MKLYQLLWRLLGLALRGRLRHDVCISVMLDGPSRSIGITGVIEGFQVLPREEGFFIIDAVSEDPAPWHESPSIENLIEEAQSREVERIKHRYLAQEFSEAEAVAQICRALPGCIPDGARSLLPPRRP